MLLLVSGRHDGAHPDGLQHGVSMQISINFGRTFLRISCLRTIAATWSRGGALHNYLLSFPRFWTSSIESFWFLLRFILNGVTLKTNNRPFPNYKRLGFKTSPRVNLFLWRWAPTGATHFDSNDLAPRLVLTSFCAFRWKSYLGHVLVPRNL